jgi:hypothetical protein
MARNHGPKRKLSWKPFADDLPEREQSRPKAPPDVRNLEPMFIRAALLIAVIALTAFYFFGAPLLWPGY